MEVLHVDEQQVPSAAFSRRASALEMRPRESRREYEAVPRGGAFHDAEVAQLGLTHNLLQPSPRASHRSTEDADGGNVLERAPAADNSSDAAAAVNTLLAGMVLHTAEMIENLPSLHAPELKMIGKCISFSTATPDADGALQRFYYTGLVSMIEVSTVVLMHVHRYTEEEYKRFLRREAHAKAEEEGQQQPHAHKRKPTPNRRDHELDAQGAGESRNHYGESDAQVIVPYGHRGAANARSSPSPESRTLDEEVRLDVGAAAAANPSAAPARLPVGERLRGAGARLLAAAARHVGIDGQAATPTPGDTSDAVSTPDLRPPHRVRLSATIGSTGPLPYISFARTCLHDVRLTRDRRSTDIALFQEPGRALRDVQYLRVFVRRYLAHTSQGNNPRRLPLRAYVVARCACPDLDEALLRQVATEEVRHLLLVDRASSKEAALRGNMREWQLRLYAAPAGLFQHTGVLFLTGLPQLTCIMSALALVVVVLYGVWFGMGMGILADSVTYEMVRERCGVLITTAAVTAFAGCNVLLHSLHMSLPLRRHLVPVVVRAVTSLAAMACCVMSAIVCATSLRGAAVQGTMHHRMAPGTLCAFYSDNRCSGYTTACANSRPAGHGNPMCACGALGLAYAPRPCQAAIDRNVRIIFAPLVAISFLLLVLFSSLQCLLFSMHVLARDLHRVRDRFGIAQQRQLV